MGNSRREGWKTGRTGGYALATTPEIHNPHIAMETLPANLPARAIMAFCFATFCNAQTGMTPRWSKSLPPREASWSHVKDMQKDSGYLATAAGGLAFVGCEHNGALLALDTRDGTEIWRHYTNGAIRTQPAADAERVFAASDDGFVHCLDHSGKLLWKSPVGIEERYAVGHGRLVSSWPVPAPPLLFDGKVFAMGGCWPADGVFMNCFDAVTGKLLWRSPSMAMRAMMVPHFIMDGKVHVRTYSGTGGKAAAFDIMTGEAHPWPKGLKMHSEERPEVPGAKGIESSNRSSGLVFGSTRDGILYCAGTNLGREPVHHPYKPGTPSGDVLSAKAILHAAGMEAGFALVYGLEDGAIVEGLLSQSSLHVVAIDPNARKVEEIRRELDGHGCFDTHRLTLLHLELGEGTLPPYFANLVLSESGSGNLGHALHSLRPYGGAQVFKRGGKWDAKFRGKLEGAGDWTHEYANASMNNSSGDTLLKRTLGILWYGGPASDRKYYLEGSRPMGALVVEGRMFLQGNGVLAAFDAYNGRLLWETTIPNCYLYSASHGGGGRGLSKSTPWDDPEADAKAEIPNIRRSRATGLNMAATGDCIYVLAGNQCLRYETATGTPLKPWEMPLPPSSGERLCWGCPRILGGTFVATAFRPSDMKAAKIGSGGNGGDWSGDRMPMSHVFALDRQTGDFLWGQAAHHGFSNRAFVVSGNRVFCTDLLQTDAYLGYLENGRKLAGRPFSLRAFDLRTGRPAWTKELNKLVKYITYDPRHDRLFVPNRYGMTWTDKGWGWPGLPDSQTMKKSSRPNGTFMAFKGTSGEPLWQVSEQHYDGPFTVTGDIILNRYGTAFDPSTGHLAARISPLTGEAETYGLKKSGCAVLGACETMVAWRTAYHDLSGRMSTQLPGFEAGCTTSLIPAGGMLNLPNYGMFHLRARAAAVAMVPREGGAQHWPSFQYSKPGKETVFQHIGFNFGAPGDHYGTDGTLWLKAYRGGDFEIVVEPKDSPYFNGGAGSDWISGSGVSGATKVGVPTALEQKSSNTKGTFDIQLHFPDNQEGKFDIVVEGETVRKDFDLARAKDGDSILSLEKVMVTGRLDVELVPKSGKTSLSGILLRRVD